MNKPQTMVARFRCGYGWWIILDPIRYSKRCNKIRFVHMPETLVSPKRDLHSRVVGSASSVWSFSTMTLSLKGFLSLCLAWRWFCIRRGRRSPDRASRERENQRHGIGRWKQPVKARWLDAMKSTMCTVDISRLHHAHCNLNIEKSFWWMMSCDDTHVQYTDEIPRQKISEHKKKTDTPRWKNRS